MGRKADCKGQIGMKLLITVFALFQITGCSMQYVVKQGFYQLELSLGAIPVEDAVEDRKLPEDEINKLHIIAALKRFSEKQLTMLPSKNYTLINPTWKTKLNSVSASKELAFEPYQWCFPIVGKVPYLGFFDKRDALFEEKKLRHRGYETMVAEIGGYSTLGFFNDPIWPQMLKRSVASLSELVLHELAHATLYFPGQSNFNENFANFVGKMGALEFLKQNYGENSKEVQEVLTLEQDEALYNEWIETTYQKLDKIYKSKISQEEIREQKRVSIRESEEGFREINFHSQTYRNLQVPKINNPFLLMSRRYNSGQLEFEMLFKKVNGDFAVFFKMLHQLKQDKDALESLKKMVSSKI